MTNHNDKPPETPARRRYIWPWFVLGAVLLAIALAVLWMSREIERTRKLREFNSPAPQVETNRDGLR
jgi:hypothetical protein